MTDDPVDVDGLIGEIDDEVRRRRADGTIDPAWERELDDMFGAAAPAGVVADFPRLLDDALRAASIDPTPPSASDRPGGEAVKRTLGRAMSWYVASVTRQVGTLGTELVEALRVLGDRVARLEVVAGPSAAGDDGLADPHVDVGPWVPDVRRELGDTSGRVLHAEAGDGAVVRALLDAGVDAYGVEPRPALAERANARDVDVREEGVLPHLDALGADALGGLVLSGGVDTLANVTRQAIARAARRAVGAGGACIVIASDPQRWGDGATRVAADLAPGRPWHADTWSHVLGAAGFTTRAVLDGDGVREGTVAVIAVRRA
jgi:hypothetical protein